jgi:hypothetical protein
MPKRQAVTAWALCVSRLGPHKGALAAANVVQLAIAQRDLGHFPTTTEYVEYWSVSLRTAKYHRSRARDAFGDELEAVVSQLAASSERSSRKLQKEPLRVKVLA